MKRLIFNGYHKHLLILVLLGIYLAAANSVYIQFILKNGKPIRVEGALPAESSEVTYKLAEMRAVRVDGEDVYELKGFAFDSTTPAADYTITVVLVSGEKQYAFKTRAPEFPSLIRSSKLYQQGMDDAEFRALISRRVLDSGVYRIGILLEEKNGEGRLFTYTGGTVRKTANTLRFKAGS